MKRFKQWALDIGLWEADDLESWSWLAFRLRFWRTHTNLTHRSYREVIAVLTAQYAQEIKDAYTQGAKDGALQQMEYVHRQIHEIPMDAPYPH